MSKADLFLFNFKSLTKSVKRLTEKIYIYVIQTQVYAKTKNF